MWCFNCAADCVKEWIKEREEQEIIARSIKKERNGVSRPVAIHLSQAKTMKGGGA